MLKIYLLREISPYPHILTYIVECEKSILIFRRNRYTFNSHNARTFLKHPTPRILPRKHPRSGGASRIYLGRGRSPYERCFAFITKDMEGKQGRGGRGLTKLHTRAVVHRIHAAPNVACSSIERKVGGGREEEEGGGGDAHSLFWREWSDTGSIRRGIRDSCSLSSGGWTTESTAVGEHHKLEGARGASKGAATRI